MLAFAMRPRCNCGLSFPSISLYSMHFTAKPVVVGADFNVTKRGFTAVERWAVYTVHGEKCYMCPRPLDLRSMQVDHIVPESLLDEPKALQHTLEQLGLPPDFQINDFGNWLPAHPDCNNLKSSTPFNPSLLIQMQLQRAAAKAEAARKLALQTISDRRLMLALNIIERALEGDSIDRAILEPVIDALIKVRDYHFRNASGHDVEKFEAERRKGISHLHPPLSFSHIEFAVSSNLIENERAVEYFGPRYFQLNPIYINAKTVVSLTAVMVPTSLYIPEDPFPIA
jgi:hypothetical protein